MRVKHGYDLVQHIKKQKSWSEKAFGPAEIDRTKGVLDHILKEVEEIKDNPKDVTEWIDLIMLGIDGAWRNGASPELIAETLLWKLERNMIRKWPDWRDADPNKAIEHIEVKQ